MLLFSFLSCVAPSLAVARRDFEPIQRADGESRVATDDGLRRCVLRACVVCCACVRGGSCEFAWCGLCVLDDGQESSRVENSMCKNPTAITAMGLEAGREGRPAICLDGLRPFRSVALGPLETLIPYPLPLRRGKGREELRPRPRAYPTDTAMMWCGVDVSYSYAVCGCAGAKSQAWGV